MLLILKVNPAAYSRKLQMFPTAAERAISMSDVVTWSTVMNRGVRHPKPHDCQSSIRHCIRESMFPDVCLNVSP